MEWIWLLAVGMYCTAVLVLMKQLRPPAPGNDYTPTVTILIAMRNEAPNLPALFTALERLEYPREQLEIWLLDDTSTDATGQLARQFAQRHAHVHYLFIDHPRPPLQGKMNALAEGIRRSRGDIILVTDADCQPVPTWVQQTVRYFQDPAVGLVGGANEITGQRWLERLQRVDLLYLLGMASAFAHAGVPLSVLGNNMAFRRTAYQAVGGFEAIGFSPTEDAALLHAIRRQGQFTILYPLIPKTMVRSTPLPSLKALWQQRLRWAVGGKQVTSWWHWGLLLPGILPRGFFWWAVLALPPMMSLLPALLLVAVDYVWIRRVFRQLNLDFSLPDVLRFELWATLYLPALALVTPWKRTIEWKQRRLRG